MFNLQRENPGQMSDRDTVLQMIRGFQISQCIYAAAKLGIVDLLADGTKSYQELATETHTHADLLYRFLRTLTSLGILEETQPNYFQNTAVATYLRDKQQGTVRNFLMAEIEESYASWGNLTQSLTTGQGAFESMYGVNIEEFHQQNSDQAEVFDQAMVDITAIQNPLILAAYDFSVGEIVADIGGGYGKFLAAILQKYPQIKGVLFEQPYCIEQGKYLLTQEGVIDRCSLITGSFFDPIFLKADIYLLKKILLNWDDQKALEILKNCRQAMDPSSRLLIVDRILHKNRWKDNLADLNLWMLGSGKIRSESEFRVLLETAGFQITKIIDSQSIDSLIEATPL